MMQKTDQTIRTMAVETGAILALIGVACIPGFGKPIAFGILILAACGSPSLTLKSLAAGTMITFVRSPFIPASAEGASVLATALKWLLLFVACGMSFRSAVQPTKINSRLLALWAVVTAALLINSFYVSRLPIISAFKSLGFSLGLLCIIRLSALASNLSETLLTYLAELGFAVFIASVPLLGLQSGYLENHNYFNGILSHPQSLGVFLFLTGVSAFAAALTVPKFGRLLVFAGLMEWSMIYFTKSRTPLVAIALGGCIYLLETMVPGGRSSRFKAISAPVLVIIISGLMLIIAISPGMREGFLSYLQKGDPASVATSDNPPLALSESSRGDQISEVYNVAKEHPILGYGFGVEPGTDTISLYGSKWAGIPLSAPIEQGFLPIATVAQIGLLGSAFVLAFLVSIYQFARSESGETAGLFAMALGVNFGEMIFYSLGGLGTLMWLLLIVFAFSGATLQPVLADERR